MKRFMNHLKLVGRTSRLSGSNHLDGSTASLTLQSDIHKIQPKHSQKRIEQRSNDVICLATTASFAQDYKILLDTFTPQPSGGTTGC